MPSKTRVCFYNPHAVNNIFGTTLFGYITESKTQKNQFRRFSYLVDVLRDKSHTAAIVADGTASSLPFSHLGRFFNSYLFLRTFSFFEVYFWCIANGINPFRQTILFSLKRLDPERDVLFGFAFFGRTFFDERMTERSIFKRYTGKKILHATHYFSYTGKVAGNLRTAGARVMIAEANLKNSDYFNKHLGFIESVRILPFVLREKYVCKVGFPSRKNKCVALGTLELFPDGHEHSKDHFEYFRTDTLHPMRKTIMENAAKVSAVLDSLIAARRVEDKRTGRWENSIFYRVYSLFAPPRNAAGDSYRKLDIVHKLNEYRMFVAPEENIGLPSVNFIEGMACGCAYVGLDDKMYRDLGLQSGVHYIGYDGTLEDMAKKIEYYQSHMAELEKIAEAGRIFVLSNFTKDKAIDGFLKTLEAL